jgi:hypothetical protein
LQQYRLSHLSPSRGLVRGQLVVVFVYSKQDLG